MSILFLKDFTLDMNFFLIIWSISFFSAVMMISVQNPVYATIFMINVFIMTSILFVFLGVEYLGLIFLMVYVGAIAILFLFVVMMIPIKQFEVDTSMYLTIAFYFFSYCF
jgi:NADH-quinone oxidoreductase subunit J